MIPTGGIINANIQEREIPSKTWRLDFDKGKVIGSLDNLEAIKQSVFCILQTDRFKHIIYSFNYGHEIKMLLGKNPLYVQSEVTRIINEALIQDNRIQRIENLIMKNDGDSLTATFTVVTNLGNFEFTQEVS